ncbi:MAG TPA: YbhB/YbcL family Raf kinase inhibitor-like protein [Candidatus Dormibacteraeota bacterium]|nr:YbhB/YbcL family Raf kinase inhibitor-like protein [Candidatus Dormibacteraeota bacterium]
MALRLSSPAIEVNGQFPVDYTCNGRNVSPPLAISGVPAAARSLVLIFDDPDAAKEPAGRGRTFDHWVLYNIPSVDQEIPENSVPASAQAGQNGRGSSEYVGPCPPTFRHAYYFRLFALGRELELPELPTKAQVLQALEGNIIEENELVAYYEQPAKK